MIWTAINSIFLTEISSSQNKAKASEMALDDDIRNKCPECAGTGIVLCNLNIIIKNKIKF